LDDSEELSLYRYLDNEAASRGGSVEAQVLDRFAEEDIKTAIEALPPQYRITVLLADVEGFSYNDIAEITNVKKGTVMSRLFRGRRLLQKALVDQARSAGFAGGKK
jgi:RNA polymerase sigma-70 factor (ECF subfamily)